MHYTVFITDRCRTDAKKHAVSAQVENLSEKIEKDQSIESWDMFIPSPYVKKNLGKSWRLIAEKRILNDDLVVIFVALMLRSSPEYIKFFKSPSSVFSDNGPSKQELEEHIQNKKPRLQNLLVKPSDIEYSYLYESKSGQDLSEGVVFESKDWVELMNRPGVQDYLTRFYDILETITRPDNILRTSIDGANKETKIIYRYDSLKKRLFLIAPLIQTLFAQEEMIRKKYNDILTGPTNQFENETLLRMSGRSYPMLIFAHEESTWKAIQKNKEGNLALSPEESFILDTMWQAESKSERRYPLFINGRPGSGKSTILQYLFAERLYLHLIKEDNQRLPNPPLYLTYSSRLTKEAKKSVMTIIQCNSDYVDKKINFSTAQNKNIFDSSFCEYHEFLQQLLSSKKHSTFIAQNRVDFARFRCEWQNAVTKDPDPQMRKLSPELVWHVIRTYIKGMRDDLGNYLDPESYLELPEKQQTVTRETYERIFFRAWERWYKQTSERNGWWDNQDIARKVLDELGNSLSNYPAIFCDEAQDFTRLELELIFRLGLFSRREIPYTDLCRIPFAFAGDPFQTLNPTGFNWGSAQAGFYEKIVQELDRSSKGKLEFNYRELSFNYRSTKNIVGFCNLIQLIRGIAFDIRDLKPQRSWSEEDSPMPAYYDIENPSCQDYLRDQTELVIILPCQEGEEILFVQQDAFLSSLGNSLKDGRNFLSAMSAKGLEFSRVVLYKYGEEMRKSYPNLLEPLNTGTPHSLSPETALPLEYYVNRLFVAASRAKRRLFIVDTSAGIGHFWKNEIFKNFDIIINQYSGGANNDWSQQDLSYMIPGSEDSWSADRDDPIQLAHMFKEAGISEKDPYKLSLAENAFMRASRQSDALECRAIRLSMEDKNEEAGGIFLSQSKLDKAIKCYWKAGCYKIIAENPLFSDLVEHRAASFNCGDKGATESKKMLEYLKEKIDNGQVEDIPIGKNFDSIMKILIDSLAEKGQFTNFEWLEILKMIKLMAQNGIKIQSNGSYAEIAHQAGKYGEAVIIWEGLENGKNHKLYPIAKSKTIPYPENLIWLDKLDDPNLLIDPWLQSPPQYLSREQSRLIAKGFLKSGRLEDAIPFFKKHASHEMILELFELTKERKDPRVFSASLHLVIKSFKNEGLFIELLQFIKDVIATFGASGIVKYFVTELSSSNELINASIDERNEIAVFLKSVLIDSPWDGTIDIRVAGSAIERAGKIMDSLVFYEKFWKTKEVSIDSNGIIFAQERWLKCKLRYVAYMKERQPKSRDTEKQIEEVNFYVKKWKYSIETIPEYANVDSLIFSVGEGEEIDTLSTDIKQIISTMAKMQRWTPQRIAESLGLSSEIVENVIRNRSKDI